MSKKDKEYEDELRSLQIGLVRYQEWAMAEGDKAVVVFEGRDGAGKDGAIARITEHLAPRNTRVVALPKPSDRDQHRVVVPALCRAPAGGGRVRDVQPLLVQPRRRRDR